MIKSSQINQITHTTTPNQSNLERPFVLLIQDACPECERMKKMLAGPLKGQFNDRIQFLHRQVDETRFLELSETHDIRTTPALVNAQSGEVLFRTGLGEVRAFLNKS